MRFAIRLLYVAVTAIWLTTFSPTSGFGQWLPHEYGDHTPYPFPPGDSCNWFGPGLPVDSCDCGSIYPKGPDYWHSRNPSGQNYDPYFDTCKTCTPPFPPPQVDHIFKVPCDYTQDPAYSPPSGDFDVEVGCFTLAFNLTQCQEGKVVDGIEIRLRDQGGACHRDSTLLTKPTDTVTVYDTVIVDKDTTITPRDSVVRETVGVFAVGGSSNSTMIYKFDRDTNVVGGGPLPPGPPCQSRSFQFDVCNLWKWGHGPAELECPTVFEIVLRNSDGTYCGIIPFVIWGSCVFPPDPKAGGGEGDGRPTRAGLYIPDVGELDVRLIRYEDGRVIELE